MLFSPLQPPFFAALSSTWSIMCLPAAYPCCSFCFSTADRACGQNIHSFCKPDTCNPPPQPQPLFATMPFLLLQRVMKSQLESPVIWHLNVNVRACWWRGLLRHWASVLEGGRMSWQQLLTAQATAVYPQCAVVTDKQLDPPLPKLTGQ